MSLIPILTNYLQDRRMCVKWNGVLSKIKSLHGGGPQGALWGILEYLSQSNDNTEYISNKDKFKFIDDLSILEKINLLCIGISSFNFKANVASDIVENGYFINPDNLKSQVYLDKIAEWTNEKQMMLNRKKS